MIRKFQDGTLHVNFIADVEFVLRTYGKKDRCLRFVSVRVNGTVNWPVRRDIESGDSMTLGVVFLEHTAREMTEFSIPSGFHFILGEPGAKFVLFLLGDIDVLIGGSFKDFDFWITSIYSGCVKLFKNP